MEVRVVCLSLRELPDLVQEPHRSHEIARRELPAGRRAGRLLIRLGDRRPSSPGVPVSSPTRVARLLIVFPDSSSFQSGSCSRCLSICSRDTFGVSLRSGKETSVTAGVVSASNFRLSVARGGQKGNHKAHFEHIPTQLIPLSASGEGASPSCAMLLKGLHTKALPLLSLGGLRNAPAPAAARPRTTPAQRCMRRLRVAVALLLLSARGRGFRALESLPNTGRASAPLRPRVFVRHQREPAEGQPRPGYAAWGFLGVLHQNGQDVVLLSLGAPPARALAVRCRRCPRDACKEGQGSASV